MSKNVNVYFNLSSIESKTVYGDPLIVKGESTINYILTGVKENSYNVLFLDIDWGDGTAITTQKRDAVYNYREQSIFDEVLYGKVGGSICVQYSHPYSNQTNSYSLNLTSCFSLIYNSGETVYFYQPLQIYRGSFYDDIVDLVAINTQILPVSSNITFVNFESKNNIQVIPSMLTDTGTTTTTTTTTVAPTTTTTTTTVAPTTTTTTTTVAPTTTTTTTTVAPINTPGILVNHLFTANHIPIDISSNSTNFLVNSDVSSNSTNFFVDSSGTPNSTITLKVGINYDFNVNSSVPFAIRRSKNDTSNIPEFYNNNESSGITNGVIMVTPVSTGTLYYVNANNPNTYGIINVI